MRASLGNRYTAWAVFRFPGNQKNSRPGVPGRLFACLGKREREKESLANRRAWFPAADFGFVPGFGPDPYNMPSNAGRASVLC